MVRDETSFQFYCVRMHTGNSFAGISHSGSLGPSVLDFGATNHISGNKSLFSTLSPSNTLPFITIANGSQTKPQDIGSLSIFPSLSVDNVLYVPGFPFNLLSISRLTRSLDCFMSFTKDCVVVQDRSSGRMIGFRCESHGLYQLKRSSHIGSAVDSPLMVHAQLGHPSLTNLKLLLLSLSKLSSLPCESCWLGKHVRSTFQSRVISWALSPFVLVHSNAWGELFLL